MNEQDVPEVPDDKERVYCHKDQSRVCGGDCVAYLTNPPPNREYEQPWAKCAELVNGYLMAKHITIIANMLHKKYSQPDPYAAVNQIKPPETR